MYDFIIVGAGPSGATLARLINKKYKVLLIDRKVSSNKCCGGLLAPDSQKVIAQLGLGIPKEVLVTPQLFTVRTIDIDNNLEKFYQRHYMNLDRDKFDRWLVSLIPPNVDVMFGCRLKEYKELDDGILVKLIKGNIEFEEKAKVIIAADGACSKVRKTLKKEADNQDIYISIQEKCRVKNYMPYFSSIFDSEISDFYSWTIPKEDYILLGTAISINDNVNEKFSNLKIKLKNYGYSFEENNLRQGAYIIRPRKKKDIYIGNYKIALIGEAAGFISPSSAEGISYALRSAIYLAKSINEDSFKFHNSYKIRTSKLRNNIVLKNMKCPFMYNKNIRKVVIKSGVLSMDIETLGK
ncbi:MAG: FAD-binding protein [Clostridiaceae bacterium]